MKSPLLLRRVVGESMVPTLYPGTLVIGWRWFKKLRPNDLVVIYHHNLEKIKRVKEVSRGTVYVTGDNTYASTDSREFGRLPLTDVRAKIVFYN